MTFGKLTLVGFFVSMGPAVIIDGFSGFYFDNGFGQTEIEYLDITDQELMREEILTLLGLTHAPDKKAPHYVDTSTSNHTVPLFMMDIYKSLTEDDRRAGILKSLLDGPEVNQLMNNPFRITSKDVKAINDSDIIMSFANRGHQEELQWTQLFWFDTNELPEVEEENLISADLRMYKKSISTSAAAQSKFNLKVYQLVEGSTGTSQLLDSLLVDYKEEGWLLLDVTNAVKLWQKDYRTNQGLMVEITEITTDHQIHPVAVGLASNRNVASDKESFMVSYFKSTDDMVRRKHRSRMKRDLQVESDRSKRSSASNRRRNHNQRRKQKKKFSNLEGDFSFSSDHSNVFRDYYGGRQRFRGCQKRVLRVSFRDLNWQDWIIAPDGYEAFYCHGECSFPLNSQMNATNHAIVQTLVHLMNPDQVPKPCCAPTKLSGISVLYFDESSNVILKKYRNMVVKTCGCH